MKLFLLHPENADLQGPDRHFNLARAMADINTTPASSGAARIMRGLFAATAVAVMVLSLLPLDADAPSLGWDKANHMAAFALLALLGCRAYPAHIPAVLAGLLAYGGLIEILQSFTDYRSAEWGDLLADALGLVLGWIVARLRAGLRGKF